MATPMSVLRSEGFFLISVFRRLRSGGSGFQKWNTSEVSAKYIGTSSSCGNSGGRNKPKVALTSDKSLYLCWHPEPEIPYEFTKPMPRNEAELQQGDSVLKVQYLQEEKSRYRPDGPTQQELMNIFHTTRHAFDYKPRMKLRKRNPPKDRDRV